MFFLDDKYVDRASCKSAKVSTSKHIAAHRNIIYVNKKQTEHSQRPSVKCVPNTKFKESKTLNYKIY